MTRRNLKVKTGDQVVAIAGDDKGKEGKVLAVYPEKDKVLVEGVNFIRKHERASETNPEGGIVEREAPIHVSNVQVVGSSKE